MIVLKKASAWIVAAVLAVALSMCAGDAFASVGCSTAANLMTFRSNCTFTGGSNSGCYTVGAADPTLVVLGTQTFATGAHARVELGVSCPETANGGAPVITVFMSRSDYEMLIGGLAVNETLSVLGIVLCAIVGLAVGFYMFRPRRALTGVEG